MRKRIYAFYDVKAANYLTPMFLNTDGEAVRTVTDIVNGKDNLIQQHPNDFRLDFLGEFDIFSGNILVLDQPLHIIDAAQCVKAEN